MPPDAPPPFFENPWLGVPFIFGLWAAGAFLLGTLFGSFFNVAIYRLPIGLSLSNPRRSFCYRCGSPIRALDNIPIVSYFIRRGRCHACGAGFSGRYAFVEFLTGALFLAAFLGHNSVDGGAHWATPWYMACIGLMIVATFTDFDHWIIPDGVTVWGSVAAVAAALAMGWVDPDNILTASGPFPAVMAESARDPLGVLEALLRGPGMAREELPIAWWMPVANSLIGLVVGPAVIWAIGVLGRIAFRKEAMGSGDVYLFALVGATLGPMNVFPVIVISSVLGMFAGLWRMLANSRGADSPLALGKETAPPGEGATLADRYADIAGKVPVSAGVHHLPFGPWIAAATVLLVVAFGPVHRAIAMLVIPG